MIRVEVRAEPIDLAAELERVEASRAGGIATFSGYVRADDGVTMLELEHYPGVTEATLRSLAEQARARWTLNAVSIIHRVGPMTPGERIVLVAAAAAHRGPALDACAFLIDRLKTDAPFWKRERRGDDAHWVEARDSDTAAGERWRP